MKGYGLTVFAGTTPERFDVEVVSVVPNFLLRQSIILIRCSHPVTDRAGIIGGMSGSPIYLDGRLAGALAYGWRFNKDPLAGVTPIRNMLDVLKRKIRKQRSGIIPVRLAKIFSPLSLLAANTPFVPNTFFDHFRKNNDSNVVPARTPISISGFFGAARSMLFDMLAPFGMDPMQGGGGGTLNDPGKFVPGGAIGVQLIRGDMSATGIGTVTAIRKNSVLAFGHPMFNMGQGLLPTSTAYIHTVISSLNRSNKLGSGLGELGSLVQDRQSCIVSRTDRKAVMIPVRYHLVDKRSGVDTTYNVEIAAHRLLTPRFLKAALLNIIQNAASDATDVTADIVGTIKISGRSPMTLRDTGASRKGLASLLTYFRPSAVASIVLSNPFENAEIESMNFDVNLRYGLEVSTITGAYLTAENPAPGDEVNLHVRLRAFGGEEEVLTFPLRIPIGLAEAKIKIQIGGGDVMMPPMPTPQNLDDILNNVARFYPPKSLVVGIDVPGSGVSLRGRLLENLPASAISSLKPSVGTEDMDTHSNVLRRVYPTTHLISGKETLTVKVGSRRNR